MTANSDQVDPVEELWRTFLTTGEYEQERRQRQFFRLLPGYPRCKNCYAPFGGLGSAVVRVLYDKHPSSMNPRLCNVCEEFARKHQGGAEIELTMLFLDIRGSTTLAEGMSPKDFSALINRFYTTATRVLISTDALIDKLIGDQVAAMYVPGFAGPEHAQRAVYAAQQIMFKTGHADADGPWVPLGAGVHTGIAFVGSVGSEDGTRDITVLGDAANTAARLSSSAKQGEILISESAYAAAGLTRRDMEERQLELKGKTHPVSVHVLTDYRSLA